jgi:hypothetical protein
MSTLGLILLADPMLQVTKRILSRFLSSARLENVAEKIGEYFLYTLAALVMTFPVMAYHFNTFFLGSILLQIP